MIPYELVEVCKLSRGCPQGSALGPRLGNIFQNVVTYNITSSLSMYADDHQVPVVRKVDDAIHRINRYPADIVVRFVSTYLLDSDLSTGWRCPAIEQLGPDLRIRDWSTFSQYQT